MPSAPLSGRISDRKVDPGNLIQGGQQGATLLATIVSTDPIYFTFDGSEALFLKAKRAAGSSASPVEIRLPDETEYRFKGRVDFLDNEVDRSSGTVRARAVVK